jgi:hypothetical protein
MTATLKGAASKRIDNVTGLTDRNLEQGMTLTLGLTRNHAPNGARLP